MREQDPDSRIKNFNEVALGYDEDQAIKEASRCISCKKPKCKQGCPVNVDIPEFISHIKEGNFEEAYHDLTKSLLFPCITGRVCPQESQCEGSCIIQLKEGNEPTAIGNLERFIGDWAMKKKISPSFEIIENGKSVAIIGSGPAGMMAAAELRKIGFYVTIYEALHEAGGVLTYGIPEFRLPKRIVQNEIHKLEKIGVKIKYNTLIGATKSFEDLKLENDGIFIGTGAGLPRFMGIPGEELVGVFTANEFLVRINLMGANKFPDYDTPINVGDRVGVVGGGNVAMDSARVALRLGADVHLFYRRTREFMPARKVEIEHALAEGIKFRDLMNPVELSGKDGKLTDVVYSINKLSNNLDKSGRRIPYETGMKERFSCDSFIIAIGQNPNPVLTRLQPNIKTDNRGYIFVNCNNLLVESVKDSFVFAGGDIIGNQYDGRGGTVIDAMGHGSMAAKNIDAFIQRFIWKKRRSIPSLLNEPS